MTVFQRCRPIYKLLIIAALAVAVPTPPANAHAVGQTLGDFYNGFLHPFSVLVYALPILVLSILIGQQGKVKTRKSMGIFITTLILGLLLPTFQAQTPIFIAINYASFIVLGILAAASLNIPPTVLLPLVGLIGFTFGYLNSYELPLAASPVLFATGVIAGFIIIFIWITAVTISFKKYWFQLGLRVLGSWVAAIGLLLMGLYL